jgi:hypothetical protein
MMKEEFEKNINLVITAEEYEEIQKAYMGLPEAVDKTRFVKIWLREGGIQDLFDKRQAKITIFGEKLKEEVREENACIMALEGKNREISGLKARIKACEQKLASIKELIS